MNNKTVLWLISLFLFTRVVMFGVGTIATLVMQQNDQSKNSWEFSENELINTWGMWDTEHYLSIAKLGYELAGQNKLEKGIYAFFPMYPLTIKFLTYITTDYLLSAILISNLALLMTSLVLYKLVAEEFAEKNIANNTLKYMYFFPTAFVFTSAYTESLFLLLSVSVFYFLHKKKYLVAGIIGGLAALTRSIGVFLVIPYIYQLLMTKENRNLKSLLWSLYIPLGTIVYMIYCYRMTGDFFGFMSAQQLWGRELGNPMQHIAAGLLSQSVRLQLNSWLTLGILSLVVLSFKYLSRIQALYALIVILVPLATGIVGIPRYTLAAFPLFLTLALLEKKHPLAGQFITYAFLLLQGALLVFWVSGYNLII